MEMLNKDDYKIEIINSMFYDDFYEDGWGLLGTFENFNIDNFKNFYNVNKHLLNEFLYELKDPVLCNIDIDIYEFTAKMIHWMTMLKRNDAVHHLLSLGVDINSKDIYGRNCLFWTNDIDMIDFLLENGAEFMRDYCGKHCFDHDIFYTFKSKKYLISKYEKKLLEESVNKHIDKPKKCRKM